MGAWLAIVSGLRRVRPGRDHQATSLRGLVLRAAEGTRWRPQDGVVREVAVTIVVVWAAITAALGGLMRKTGPWWRVALGCAAWPVWPVIAGISYARHRARKARTRELA